MTTPTICRLADDITTNTGTSSNTSVDRTGKSDNRDTKEVNGSRSNESGTLALSKLHRGTTSIVNSFPAQVLQCRDLIDIHRFTTYVDYSRALDPDPLTTLTPIGKMPNFPAKLHAILSRKDFADIICWLPHGRSWRILKSRDFENYVMPKYFGQTKFSSFQRQANGWGFRRFTNGMSSDSYVHPLFLRGLPFLSKFMKRCSSEKDRGGRFDLEDLDLDRVSKMYPVPDAYPDDSVLLPCILQDGPKARMPVVALWKPKLSDFASDEDSDLVERSSNDKSANQGKSQDQTSQSPAICVDEPNASLTAYSSSSGHPGTYSGDAVSQASTTFVRDHVHDLPTNMLKTLAEVSVARCSTDRITDPQKGILKFPMSRGYDEGSAQALSNSNLDQLHPRVSVGVVQSNQVFGNLSESHFGDIMRPDVPLYPRNYLLPRITSVPVDTDSNTPKASSFLSSNEAMSYFTAGYVAASAMNANSNTASMHENTCSPFINVNTLHNQILTNWYNSLIDTNSI